MGHWIQRSSWQPFIGSVTGEALLTLSILITAPILLEPRQNLSLYQMSTEPGSQCNLPLHCCQGNRMAYYSTEVTSPWRPLEGGSPQDEAAPEEDGGSPPTPT